MTDPARTSHLADTPQSICALLREFMHISITKLPNPGTEIVDIIKTHREQRMLCASPKSRSSAAVRSIVPARLLAALRWILVGLAAAVVFGALGNTASAQNLTNGDFENQTPGPGSPVAGDPRVNPAGTCATGFGAGRYAPAELNRTAWFPG